MARIDAFLKLGLAQGCSDIHLAVGIPPMLRLHGDLMPIKFRDLGDTELEGYVDEILSESQRERFRRRNDIDFSYVSSDGGRFRVNIFHKATGVGATFRNIPSVVPSLDSLNLPPILHKFCDLHQGMVLVTGSTGTGKSTTLAAMIDHINTTSSSNIISLEDPIEFVHSSKRSQIIQRELGTHIPSFAEGVRASLREDPDVILVGELRDGETISMAMTAAETGHLVLGTLHTTSAVKSIDRIIDALPGDQREQTARRRDAEPHQDTRWAGPPRDRRGYDHESRHREADSDRADSPDSGAAADRQGPGHAADGSSIAACSERQARRPRRCLSLCDGP